MSQPLPGPSPGVEVQHILIGVPHRRLQGVERTHSQAEALAPELLLRLQAGADFDELAAEHSDDKHSTVYRMTQAGKPPRPGIYRRDAMMASFGNVAWRLQVDEIGVAPFHPKKSVFGWHIIQRLR